jgi:hypothetical protein
MFVDILITIATRRVEHQHAMLPQTVFGGVEAASTTRGCLTWMRSRDAGRLYVTCYETTAL